MPDEKGTYSEHHLLYRLHRVIPDMTLNGTKTTVDSVPIPGATYNSFYPIDFGSHQVGYC